MARMISLRSDAGKREVTRFLKFSVVGSFGALIDYGLLNLLILLAGLPKLVANGCSFTAAVLSNFVWNRYWTYPESRSRPVSSQLRQFAFLNVIGLCINMLVFLSVDRYLLGVDGIFSSTVAHVSLLVGIRHAVLAYNLSKACATAVALFWNFGSNRLVTYRGL